MIKPSILDVPASFRTSFWRNLDLDTSVQKSLILQQKIRGYKKIHPTTKQHKALQDKMVYHI